MPGIIMRIFVSNMVTILFHFFYWCISNMQWYFANIYIMHIIYRIIYC